jgi:outer membrane protein OmpA-like peptidoglycan-associated protein
MLRALGILGTIALFAAGTFAQEAPRVEVPLDYSFVRFNPQNNIAPFSLNGGGGAFTYYLNNFLGIEGDLQGYASTTRNFTIPATSPVCNNGGLPCTGNVQGNLFTYNAGPIIKFRLGRFEPFAEALGGGAHSNVYGNLVKHCPACVFSRSPSNNAWDFIIGGGLDIPLTRRVTLRPAQFDYVLTRFGNNFTHGNNNQSNFRYQAGLVFRFGAPPPVPNRPPTASCTAEPTHIVAGSGDMIVVSAVANDPDGDPLTYAWTASGGAIEGTGANVRWKQAGIAPGTYSATARVDDGRGGATSCTTEIQVEPPPNRPPTISCLAEPSTVHPGDRVRIHAAASDPDNDPLTFAWRSSGGNIVGSGADIELDTRGLAPSRYTVSGRVDDGRGGSADCSAEVNVEAPPPPPAVEARLAIRSIYFPTGLPTSKSPDAGLVESQQQTLTSLANDFKEYLKSKPDAHLVLAGHADKRGTAEFNQALSERRVEATKEFLVRLGVPAANLETKAYGEEENMSQEQVKELVEQHPNLTADQRNRILSNLRVVTLAQNRRVDITLSSTGQQSVRQFPFNAEDALTLLSPTAAGSKHAAKKKPTR